MNGAYGRLALVACLLLGGLLAHRAQATDTVVYYHTDALRSVAVVTNAAGQVIERTYYAPYGAVLRRPLRDGPGYTGHREDAETGLVYMQQRYYDPETGRFLSTDPVQADDKGGSFNRYWYANNNPYRYADPDGQESWLVNRGIQWTEHSDTSARHPADRVTHTFIMVTDKNGNVEHTYSWGNAENKRGWNKDQSIDMKAGKEAMEKHLAENISPTKDIDPYVAKAFDSLNKPENEHRNGIITNNCKTEAAKLISTAETAQAKDQAMKQSDRPPPEPPKLSVSHSARP